MLYSYKLGGYWIHSLRTSLLFWFFHSVKIEAVYSMDKTWYYRNKDVINENLSTFKAFLWINIWPPKQYLLLVLSKMLKKEKSRLGQNTCIRADIWYSHAVNYDYFRVDQTQFTPLVIKHNKYITWSRNKAQRYIRRCAENSLV